MDMNNPMEATDGSREPIRTATSGNTRHGCLS